MHRFAWQFVSISTLLFATVIVLTALNVNRTNSTGAPLHANTSLTTAYTSSAGTLCGTPSPGSTASPTSRSSPTHTATSTPTPTGVWSSPTPSPPRPMGPTVTAAPGAASTPIDVPPAVDVSGIPLTADLATSLGSSGGEGVIGLDGSRAAILFDRRLWLADIGGTRIEVLGSLEVDATDVSALHFVGDLVAMLKGSRIELIDVSDATAPRLATHHDLPGEAAHIASDGDRIIVANDGAGGEPVWMIVLAIESPSLVHVLASASPPVARLDGVFAGAGFIATNSVIIEDSEERAFWQLFRTDSLPDFTIVMEGAMSELVSDMDDRRLLIHGGSSLTIYDLLADPNPTLLGSWTETGTVTWSQLNGDHLRYLRICADPSRKDCEWIYRIDFPVGRPPIEISRTAIPGVVTWCGPGAFCISSTGTGLILCTGESDGEVAFDPHEFTSDGDRRPNAACVDAALAGSDVVLHCGDGLFWLRASDDGPLRVAESRELFEFDTDDVLSANGNVYVHSWDRLYQLVWDGSSWQAIRIFIDMADHVFVSERWLVSLDDRRDDEFDLYVRAAEPISTTLRRARLTEMDPSARALVSEEAMYIRRNGGDWGRIPLADGGDLSVDKTIPGSILDRAVIRQGIAYRMAISAGPGGSERRALQAFDLDTEPPSQIATLSIDDAVDWYTRGRVDPIVLGGDMLYIDRGDGWITRVDVSSPRRPMLLDPSRTTIDDPTFVGLSDGRLAIVGPDKVEIAEVSEDRSRAAVLSWKRWGLTAADQSVAVLGGRLYVGQASAKGGLEREQWIYDLDALSALRRVAHVTTESVPALGWSGQRLETIGDGGYRLLSSEFGDGGSLEFRSSWCAGNSRCPPFETAEPMLSLVSTRNVVFTLGNSGTLHVFTRLAEGHPVHSSSWRFEGLGLGELHLVAGSVLMVRNCLGEVQLFDVRDPGAIVPLGTLTGLPGGVDAIETSGTMAVFVIGDRMLLIDFSLFERPLAFGHFRFDSPVIAVDVDSNTIVAAVEDRVWWFDRPSAWEATTLGSMSSGRVSDLAISDWTLYFVNQGRGEIGVLQNLRPVPIRGHPIWLPSLHRKLP